MRMRIPRGALGQVFDYERHSTAVLHSLGRKHGCPPEVQDAVALRFYRIRDRFRVGGRPSPSQPEVEALILRLAAKVCRQLIGNLTSLGHGLTESEARRILGIPATIPSAALKQSA
jgi:hypothetical protein